MDITEDARATQLPPPYVPGTVYDGLGYKDLLSNPDAHIIVGVGPWLDFRQYDKVEVLIGRQRKVVATGFYVPTDTQQILLPVACKSFVEFGDGFVDLVARVTGPLGSTVFESEKVTLYVKTSLPGGTDTHPDTPYLNEGLARASITPSPIPDDLNGIRVTIPPYRNMAAGDQASVRWNHLSIPLPTVALDDVGRALTTAVPREAVTDGAGGDVEVRYQIYDRVANWSLWSPPVTVAVPPDLATAPVAPWVLGTVDELGDAIDLRSINRRDVRVRVNRDSAWVGSAITVVWAGVTSAGKSIHFETPPLTGPDSQAPVEFVIPYEHVAALAASTASVSYRIVRESGAAMKSRVRRLSIEGHAAAILPPTVVEAVNDTLDPTTLSGVAHVLVPAWVGIDAGDRCFLEWEGTRADGSATSFSAVLTGAEADSDGKIVFAVPASAVVQLAGGSVRLRYTITFNAPAWRNGEVRSEPIVHLESPWVTLKVLETAPPLSINSSLVELATPIFRLEKPVITPPDGAYVTRVASGGIPPYRYSTADGAVEVDEHSGRVVSLRNGKARVIVTDARGSTAAYEVTVSKVSHLVDLGSDQFYQHATNLAQQGGGRLPWAAEWDAMRALYAGAPDVAPAAAWCIDGAGNRLQYCVYPNTGAREVRRSYPGVRSEVEDDPERWIPIGKPMQAARAWMVILANA
ncbi:hypothetical protein [Luteibacter yeojuensis]|uniref:BIG2 domain-containing protein n=1 Tax=Luteibacter yeojuensis TaxID=345309 RepID=A0A0F3KHE4_9GAMM|nr:hypothetical protein [Luteibacter yeojuensis]KJV30422.1 hypothetical protein VI08_15040 [Luteibacter yeojuensis]